jgi:O-antigen/teichoic acid export membrane protein
MSLKPPDPEASERSESPNADLGAVTPTQEVDTGPGGTAAIHRVWNSTVNLVGRFGAITLLSAISTIAVTRLLGPSGYGVYGSAVAVAAVLGAFSDFGFSIMLMRDMADDAGLHRPLLRSAYEVSSAWSGALALAMIVMAFTAPIGSERGIALLVLAPSMLFNGLNPARVFFYVTYRTGTLVRIDLIVAACQMAAAIAVAALHFGPIGVTAVVSVASIVNNVVVAVATERRLPRSGSRFSRRELVRRSTPLGLMAIMTKVYLTIDLVLLGWYVAGPKLGNYAAASKLLTVLAGVAGTVVGGALPALASTNAAFKDMTLLLARLWHWLMVTAVPMFAALALFAPLAVQLALGARYAGAVPLIRILCLAGGITVISNLVGNVMVAKRRMRQLFLQNLAAIVVNVSGNLLLIPHYGVYAAAWLTSITEVLVCSASVLSLRTELDFRSLASVSLKPLLAAVLAAAPALILIDHQWAALGSAAVVFILALTALSAWPPEFRRLVSRTPLPPLESTP